EVPVRPPLLVGYGEEGSATDGPGVVHQDVDATPALVHGRHHALDLFQLREVGRDRQRFGAGVATDARRRSLEHRGISRAERYPHPFGGEGATHREADAPAAPRHQGETRYGDSCVRHYVRGTRGNGGTAGVTAAIRRPVSATASPKSSSPMPSRRRPRNRA